MFKKVFKNGGTKCCKKSDELCSEKYSQTCFQNNSKSALESVQKKVGVLKSFLKAIPKGALQSAERK